MMWFKTPTVEFLNKFPNNGLSKHLGIEYTEVGDDYLMAKMPVNTNTLQPYGLLHGGASCVLAESLGSVASNFCINTKTHIAVGSALNTNHIASIKSGYVYGKVIPLHIGKTTHIWEISIRNESGKLISKSQLTCLIKVNNLEI